MRKSEPSSTSTVACSKQRYPYRRDVQLLIWVSRMWSRDLNDRGKYRGHRNNKGTFYASTFEDFQRSFCFWIVRPSVRNLMYALLLRNCKYWGLDISKMGGK